MTLLTFSILAIEPFLDGIITYFAPKWLLSPGNGFLRSIPSMSGTSHDTSYLDPTNRIPLMAAGAWYLSMATMQMLAKDVIQKRALLKVKLCSAVLLSMVFLRAAFTSDRDNSFLRPEVIGLKAGIQIANIMWILSDMIRSFSVTKDTVTRTPLKQKQLLFLSFSALYGTTWAAIMLFYPDKFAGEESRGLWKNISPDQSQWHELTILASRLGGALCLTHVLSTLDNVIVDQSVERFSWWNTQSVIVLALHTLLFVRAALNSTGDRMRYLGMSVMHALLLAASLKIGPTFFDEMKFTCEDKKIKKTDGGSVPGLSDEMHTKSS